MSTKTDYGFDHESGAVTIYIAPHLYTEWQTLRLKRLSERSAPLFRYNGSNLYHMIRTVGGSTMLANALAGSVAVSHIPGASITIDFGDDEIRFGHAHYYQRNGAGRMADPLTCRSIRVECHD